MWYRPLIAPSDREKNMVSLTEDLKLEIVTRIAQFESYASISSQVSADHGIRLDRVQVRAYDPTTSKYCAGERWRSIFATARAEYLRNVSGIPIAHQGYRLQMLQRLADKALEEGDAKGLREALKLAAREVGGAMTNERSITFDGRVRARDMTPDERREALMSMLDERMTASLN